MLLFISLLVCWLFQLAFFCSFLTANVTEQSRCWSRWESVDRGQYRFKPIKFMNLVAPYPCEFTAIEAGLQKLDETFQDSIVKASYEGGDPYFL